MGKKRTSCKYDNSRIGFTNESGKFNSYARCDMCGKWHKGQYGLILDFTVPDNGDGDRTATGYNFNRIKLCRKCGKELAPELLSLAEKLWNRTPKEDTSELGLKIKEAERRIFESIIIPCDDEDE